LFKGGGGYEADPELAKEITLARRSALLDGYVWASINTLVCLAGIYGVKRFKPQIYRQYFRPHWRAMTAIVSSVFLGTWYFVSYNALMESSLRKRISENEKMERDYKDSRFDKYQNRNR